MTVQAKQRAIRIAPRKMRLVADMVRGLDTAQAQTQLRFANRGAAKTVLTVLNSAIANAKENAGWTEDNLLIKEIKVDEGPTLKRWRPRAQGRAFPIMKRTSHLSIVLGEKVKSKTAKKQKAKKTAVVKSQTDRITKDRAKPAGDRPAEEKSKGGLFDKTKKAFGRKLFRRKGNM